MENNNQLTAWRQELWGTDDVDELRKKFAAARRLPWHVGWEPRTRTTFPYYHSGHDRLNHPPLPTPDDVEKQLAGRIGRPNVLRVNGVYAVKWEDARGCPDLFVEAENLLFLQEHAIRVPRLFAAFEHQGADPRGFMDGARYQPPIATRAELPPVRYMITEWIDGTIHDDHSFMRLEPRVRAALQRKIGHQLQLLRSIPPPHPAYYGRIHGQPFASFNSCISIKDKDIWGPFHSYDAFLKHLHESFRYMATEMYTIHFPEASEFRSNTTLFASIFVDNMSKDAEACEPKLTHGDLQYKNMVFVPASNGSDKIEDTDPVLIDWQTMAWMPAWSEIERILHDFTEPSTRDDDLLAFSKEIQPFPLANAEFARQLSLATYLGGGWM